MNNCLAELIKQMKVENHIRSNIQLEMSEDQLVVIICENKWMLFAENWVKRMKLAKKL